MKNAKLEFKTWGVYFLTLLFANFFHELGHCIPAWTHGYSAIPTPAKEYLLSSIPADLIKYISLGGIISSALFSVLSIIYFVKSSYRYSSALLAGALAMPSIYTLRFILSGRGHDATEFQEAQLALGFSYSGHFVDWLFLSLLMLGIATWIIRSKPSTKILGRLLVGAIISIVFIVLLQKINNLIFDPLFSRKPLAAKTQQPTIGSYV
jgi:hypothetical protein